jgi:hypothetical protein
MVIFGVFFGKWHILGAIWAIWQKHVNSARAAIDFWQNVSFCQKS